MPTAWGASANSASHPVEFQSLQGKFCYLSKRATCVAHSKLFNIHMGDEKSSSISTFK